jgi:hypothetical protein
VGNSQGFMLSPLSGAPEQFSRLDQDEVRGCPLNKLRPTRHIVHISPAHANENRYSFHCTESLRALILMRGSLTYTTQQPLHWPSSGFFHLEYKSFSGEVKAVNCSH